MLLLTHASTHTVMVAPRASPCAARARPGPRAAQAAAPRLLATTWTVLMALALGLPMHPCAPPGEPSNETSTIGFYPLIGPLTPSQYIRDFVAAVFRGEEDEALDSGEDLRAENSSDLAANPGFEPYWPGSGWVYKQAEIDFCNTSSDSCNAVYRHYGEVCAANHDSTVHHTFPTLCHMIQENCLDGTKTLYTKNNDSRYNYTWFHVPRGVVTLEVHSPEPFFITLAKEKDNFDDTPNYYTFMFGFSMDSGRLVLSKGNQFNNWWWVSRWRYFKEGNYKIPSDRVEKFTITRNDTLGLEGEVYLTFANNPWRGRRERFDGKSFLFQYLGVTGGTPESPSYWKISGLSRGWLAVYRGPCKQELATLPTEAPQRMKEKLDVDLYNFAGRLDEFGYNFSRVPCDKRWDSTQNKYVCVE